MDGITTLHFSEKALERARRRMLIIELCMPVSYAAFLFLTPWGRIGTGIGIAVALIILLGIETILIVESGIFFRKMKETTLTISPEEIERTGGRTSEKIAFGDIRKALITEYPSGQVASIRVDWGDQRPAILHGFDNMDWVAERIEGAVSDKAVVIRKRASIDWDQPWFLVATTTLIVLAILLIQRLDRNIYAVLNLLFLISFGLASLVYRPISRSLGKRFEKFEVILGVFHFCRFKHLNRHFVCLAGARRKVLYWQRFSAANPGALLRI